MKALLIGGSGYVGGRLAAYLKRQGHDVAVTTRRVSQSIPAWLQADEVITVPDFQTMPQVFQGRDIVFHLAAPDEVAAQKNPLDALRAGAELTWTIVDALRVSGAGCPLIYLSTFHVYGGNAQGEVTEKTPAQPVHPYALGRYLGECVVQSFRERYKLKALCVRLSNSFGAPANFDVQRWSLVFNDLCLQAVRDKRLVLNTPGLQERNFITLHDVTRALEFLALHSAEWPQDGIMHLGSAIQMSILKAAETVAACCQDVLGMTPPLTRPEAGSGKVPAPFIFNIDRLTSLDFKWENPIEDEIKNTLTLCRQRHTAPL